MNSYVPFLIEDIKELSPTGRDVPYHALFLRCMVRKYSSEALLAAIRTAEESGILRFDEKACLGFGSVTLLE